MLQRYGKLIQQTFLIYNILKEINHLAFF